MTPERPADVAAFGGASRPSHDDRERDESLFIEAYRMGGAHVAAALTPSLEVLAELLNGEDTDEAAEQRERVRHSMAIARNAHNSAGELARWWIAEGLERLDG